MYNSMTSPSDSSIFNHELVLIPANFIPLSSNQLIVVIITVIPSYTYVIILCRIAEQFIDRFAEFDKNGILEKRIQ